MKEQIFELLEKRGFTRFETKLNENCFEKMFVVQSNQQLIVNGQPQPVPPKNVRVVISYFGEGEVDGRIVYGISIGPDVYGDLFYIETTDELTQMLNSLLPQ